MYVHKSFYSQSVPDKKQSRAGVFTHRPILTRNLTLKVKVHVLLYRIFNLECIVGLVVFE